MVNINSIHGIEAYNRVMNASKGVRPQEAMQAAEQSIKVLRSGDDLEVVSIGKPSAASPAAFPEILNEVVKEQTRKIKLADKKVTENLKSPEGGVEGGSLVEIMAAVNESEMALQIVIAARDRFINSYQEILKMPL
jgi:flagellar hook-basal body complex protein FliE